MEVSKVSFFLYEKMGLTKSATPEEIKSSFIQLSKKYHPDKMPKDVTEDEREYWEDRYKNIQLAYEILGDEKRRVDYDNFLNIGRGFEELSNIYRNENGEKREIAYEKPSKKLEDAFFSNEEKPINVSTNYDNSDIAEILKRRENEIVDYANSHLDINTIKDSGIDRDLNKFNQMFENVRRNNNIPLTGLQMWGFEEIDVSGKRIDVFQDPEVIKNEKCETFKPVDVKTGFEEQQFTIDDITQTSKEKPDEDYFKNQILNKINERMEQDRKQSKELIGDALIKIKEQDNIFCPVARINNKI